MLRRLVPVVALITAAFVCSGRAASAPVQARLDTKLPSWLAPGAQLVTGGAAEPGTVIELSRRSTVVASVTVGDDGRFSLRARVASVGLHQLTSTSPNGVLSLGALNVRPLRLAAVGDVNLGDEVASAIAARGAAYPWRATGRVLRGADIATANLECAVSARGERAPAREFAFRAHPSALSGAAAAGGLDVVSVANNHALDFGRIAFLDTMNIARRRGIRTVGGGTSLAAARRPALVAAGGLRIAFLGYSDVRPDGFTATASTAGTAPAEIGAIRADVQAARRRADVVVVWFHWGEELARTATSRQRLFASAALNAGAQVVLGAHPHVLQAVIRPGRRALVAWSLGNFVFPPHSPGTDRTGILHVELAGDGVVAHRLQPARIVGVQPRLTR